MPAKKTDDNIVITEMSQSVATFCVLGVTPLICNRMSEKSKWDLLMGGGKKNAAEKASSAKHDPMKEYRESPYTTKDDSYPTRIQLLSSMFKGAMKTAALDLPGTNKSKVGRLVWVESDRVPVWGIPQMMMSVVRSADMNKTPDIRTRAILPEWAAKITIRFADSVIKLPSLANLLNSGGKSSGIGDWRIEKGSGNYGAYRIVMEDDPQFQEIVRNGGRAEQDAALDNPLFYDDETESMYSWFVVEAKRRGFKVVA
jgi:hypothetical protein